MSRKDNNPTLIGLTQQLKPDLWTWASDPQDATVLDSDALSLGTYLVDRLEQFGCKVESGYAIIHDKDELDQWNAVTHVYDRVPKERHIHAVFKFVDRKSSASLEQLAGFLGVEPQYVEKPKAGRHSFDNMLAYLIHAKYRDKYQYQAEEVATLRGKEYMDIYAQQREVWAKGAAKIKTKNANESAEYLRDLILEGVVSKEQIMLTHDLYIVYSRHKTMMEDAFDTYGQRRAYQAAAKLDNGGFRTTVVYIWGESYSGKTYITNNFIKQVKAMAKERGERWDLYKAATSNPLDDWLGEEIVFLDDLRSPAMEANDWLLLLDPVNTSPASARYSNKQRVAPRLIILTAPIPPDEYFFYTRNKGNVDEALDQFIRRLAVQVKVQYVDGQRFYSVSSVGRLEKPVHAELGTGYYGRTVELSFGAVETINHSYEGAIGSLMGYLNYASPDIALSEASGWEEMQRLTESERTCYLELCAKKELKVIEARKEAEEEAARKAEEDARKAEEKAVQAAAEYKAAEDRRKAAEQARKQREKEVLTAKKAELLAAGRSDLISKVKIEYVDGEPHAVVVSPDGSNDPDLKWTI